MSNAVSTIEEAVRVIRSLDDKSHQYRNQVNLLYAALSEEHSDAFDLWEEMMEDIIIYLQDAEEQRKNLLESMGDYLAALQEKGEEDNPIPRHPLLRRSGRR